MDWLFKLFTIAKDLLGHSPQDIKDWLIVLAIAVAAVIAVLIQFIWKKTLGHPPGDENAGPGVAITKRMYGIFSDNSTNITYNIGAPHQDPLIENEVKNSQPPESDLIIQQNQNDKAEQELSTILSFRVFGHLNAQQNIQSLRRRVSNGNDLSAVTASIKYKIDYWTARLCAPDSETLDLAKQILEELRADAPQMSLHILDALIAETEGDKDKALRLLRDQDDPDSRATFFAILFRSHDERKALNWLELHEERGKPDFFTPIGWFNWAKCMSKLGRWEEAVRHFLTLDVDRLRSEMPALALIEGQINAAMLLPDDFRGMVLESIPLYTGITASQGADKGTFHTRATNCFEYFSQHPVVLDDKQFTKFITDWKLWLRLMSPNITIVNAACNEIRQLMKKGDANALDVIDIAHVFNISYDNKPLKQYLEQRKEFGGLTDSELNAECLINERVMPPNDRVLYLDQHQSRLRNIMPRPFFVAMQVAALVEDNQTEKARALVEEHAREIGEMRSEYLLAIISRREGKDVRQDLEKLYQKEKSLPVLQSLVSWLRESGDRKKLLPYARDLFERVRNEDNALNVIWCLGDEASFDHVSILDFLKDNADILDQSDELNEVKAYALFCAGQFQEAKQINDTLLDKQQYRNALYLDIKIAVCSGDWEHIATIIERVWTQRESSESDYLMTLAHLAGQLDKTPHRALELAVLATKKAPNEPRILASAYWLHFQLGHEDEVNPDWLKRATVLSSDDDGPLWSVDINELVKDWIPKRQDHLQSVEKKWSNGELPTSVAVGKFNMPISRFILEVSARNTHALDAQRRTILPLIAGGRPPITLQDNWTIGLDSTSILLLVKLGLLETALGAFHHVKFSPNVMELLLHEKSEARFHQPSRVKAANQVQQLLNRGQLSVTNYQGTPPQAVTREVGPELAALLHAARDNDGKVICVLPIYKADSLMEQHGDISVYKDDICTLIDLCALLKEGGKINAADYDRAIHYFNSQGQTEHTNLSISALSKPIFLERTVISYLQDVNMLQPIAASGLDLRVHPNVLEEQQALIEAASAGDVLIDKIEGIRQCLRDAVNSGSASFLPYVPGKDEQVQHHGIQFESTMSLLMGGNKCDVFCIDDRFYNKYLALPTPTGENVPIVCVLDLLRYLLDQERINVVEHWGHRHTLRQAGFAFIPLESDELIHWLKGAQVDNGQLIESMELRVIRQGHAHFSASGLTNPTEAQALSVRATTFYGQVITGLWEDEELTSEQAATLSDWVWRQLLPISIMDRQQLEQDANSNLVRELIANNLTLLFLPLRIQSQQARHVQYTHWLDRNVLHPLRIANADVIEKALTGCQEVISNLDHDVQKMYGNFFLKQLPEIERGLVLRRDTDFADRCGFEIDYLLTIGPDIELEGSTLFAAVKDVFATNKEVTVHDKAAKSVSIGLAKDGSIIIGRADNKDDDPPQKVTIPELTLLSPNPEARLAALGNIIVRLGPTATDCRDILKDITDRAPNHQELSSIFKETSNGFTALQSRLVHKISRGLNFSAEDVVPQSIAYFERFVGPTPDALAPESYFKEVLIPYRKKLLSRDLVGGLDICCLGSLLDELAPGQWVSDFDNDTLWNALNACHAKSNPFSLLGALDVALYRQDDPRFRGFAEEAVTQLLDKDFGQQSGTDLYRLLLVTANFILNRVHLLENGYKYPGYWKRIGVWMQAGLVIGTMAESGGTGDIDGFQQRTQESMFLGGFFAEFINAWKETAPIMSHASQAVRDEIFGRLLALKIRHEKEGRQLPNSENMNHVFDQYRKGA